MWTPRNFKQRVALILLFLSVSTKFSDRGFAFGVLNTIYLVFWTLMDNLAIYLRWSVGIAAIAISSLNSLSAA